MNHLLPGHNQGLIGSEYLVRMAEAFEAVATGGARAEPVDGYRQYYFENFSIIVGGTDNAAAPAGGE